MTTPLLTCYMCDAQESSREHVPPLCLFPEEKEIGRNFRKNLITVPSCAEHNLKKSSEDEYFRAVVLMIAVRSNAIAQHQFLGKFLRGVSRNRNNYSNFFTDINNGVSGGNRVLQIDRVRFDKCIDHIARAIFFKCYGSKWQLPMTVASPSFLTTDKNEPIFNFSSHRAIEFTRQFLGQSPLHGDNPEIFKYRLRYETSSGLFAFAACFYDFFEIYSASSKEISDEITT